MHLINILFVLFPFLNNGAVWPPKALNEKSLFVCYGKIDPLAIRGYELVVLDAGHYTKSDITVFKNNNEKVVAYISLTEVNENDPLFQKLKPYCLSKNNNWGSWYIDIGQKEATDLLLQRINQIASQGFDGLFMDNLDNVSPWGYLKTEEASMTRFLENIRREHGQFYLCQNSGLSLNAKISKLTDAVVIESLVSNYDFQKKEYVPREKDESNTMLKNIERLRKTSRKPIYILEYTDDIGMMKIISKELMALQLPYYITQIDLQQPSIFLNTVK